MSDYLTTHIIECAKAKRQFDNRSTQSDEEYRQISDNFFRQRSLVLEGWLSLYSDIVDDSKLRYGLNLDDDLFEEIKTLVLLGDDEVDHILDELLRYLFDFKVSYIDKGWRKGFTLYQVSKSNYGLYYKLNNVSDPEHYSINLKVGLTFAEILRNFYISNKDYGATKLQLSEVKRMRIHLSHEIDHPVVTFTFEADHKHCKRYCVSQTYLLMPYHSYLGWRSPSFIDSTGYEEHPVEH